MSILFFTLAQILTKNKEIVHYYMIIACLGVVYINIYTGTVDTGYIVHFPALYHSDISAFFFTIPAICLGIYSVLHDGKKPEHNYLSGFILPALFALGFGIVNGIRVSTIQKDLRPLPGHFSSPTQLLMTSLVYGLIIFVFVFNLLVAHRLKKTSRILDIHNFRHQTFFLIIYFCLSLLLPLAVVYRSELLHQLVLFFYSISILVFGLSRIHVSYFSPDHGPGEKAPVKHKQWDYCVDDMTNAIEVFMRNSAPYCHPKLSINQLADMLQISPKQLSFHFHTYMGTNFCAYVNHWRLEATCKDLVLHPELSVLEIAYKNGFNSKSSFNTIFLKKYGMSPREYRKKSKNSTARPHCHEN